MGDRSGYGQLAMSFEPLSPLCVAASRAPAGSLRRRRAPGEAWGRPPDLRWVPLAFGTLTLEDFHSAERPPQLVQEIPLGVARGTLRSPSWKSSQGSGSWCETGAFRER